MTTITADERELAAEALESAGLDNPNASDHLRPIFELIQLIGLDRARQAISQAADDL